MMSTIARAPELHTKHPGLTVAGQSIPDAWDLIRAYCGLTGMTWGYEFYDARPSVPDDQVAPEDVMAAAALNARFSRAGLEAFASGRAGLAEVLRALPTDVSLEDADDQLLAQVASAIARLAEGELANVEQTILTKVLHRKRPRLIPPYDRTISERYARAEGDRQAGRGVRLLARIRSDLQANRDALAKLQGQLAVDLDGRLVPSRLRLLDIAVWMDAYGREVAR